MTRTTHEGTSAIGERTLSADHAFVVQLEAPVHGRRRRLTGRVEHVPTGEAKRFRSMRELVGFMGGFSQTTKDARRTRMRRESGGSR